MSAQRISIVLLHSWYHFKHSMETWVDLFLNSIVQMVVFIFIALYLSGGVNSERGTFMLAGAILWNAIWVGQYGITIGALWEIWHKSFSSLFVTPLSIEEFIVGQMISGFIKAIAALAVTGGIGYLMYGFSLFELGGMLAVYIMELMLFSWALGLFVLALIIRFGTSIQSLSWMLVFLFQPIGAVFYPVTILPEVVRPIAYALPITYIFEAVRYQLTMGTVHGQNLAIATIMNIIVLIASYVFLKFIYAQAKKSGAFARMEG